MAWSVRRRGGRSGSDTGSDTDIESTPYDRLVTEPLQPMSSSSYRRDLSGFSGRGYDKGRSKVWQVAWFATQHVVFKSWWCPVSVRPHILRAFGATVGRGALIRTGVRVHWPWKLEVGDHVWIGEGAWLLNLEPITLADNVCVSQEALLCTGSHDRRSPTFEFDNASIRVEDGAWVAARGVVLRGVTIGEGALVGAGAVAVRDVPAGGSVLATMERSDRG
jgi:putative colanic acid biosynthesis acetyltransferase WcaF